MLEQQHEKYNPLRYVVQKIVSRKGQGMKDLLKDLTSSPSGESWRLDPNDESMAVLKTEGMQDIIHCLQEHGYTSRIDKSISKDSFHGSID